MGRVGFHLHSSQFIALLGIKETQTENGYDFLYPPIGGERGMEAPRQPWPLKPRASTHHAH
ncbi:hypothetical protein SLEP1_g46039 [Rubroshorea leprosula]|uniref:Uncharacterized protein n=1 Tax=Rubroshorea leprosula TaxID=152421 RepID=A0AAV5LKY3_9ROSI|nr:hypothetical protein SLEP1_g46039 [Rubroshorea leprosula]